MIPEVSQTIKDRGLGITTASARTTHMKVGLSSSGTLNTPVTVVSPNTLVDTFTSGQLVDAGAYTLDQAGGPLVLVRADKAAPGAAGSVTATVTGTGTLSVAGGAEDVYSVIVEIMADGGITVGTASFRYSLDGGKNYTQNIAVPVAVSPATTSTYPLPNTGLTLTFTHTTGAGFKTGDKFTFTTTGPTTNATLISAAITAGLASSTPFAFIHVVGAAATADDAAALATTIGSLLTSAEQNHRYLFAIIECPDVTKTQAKAAFASFAHSRVMVVYGQTTYITTLNNQTRTLTRTAAWAMAAKISAVEPGQSAAEVDLGPLGGILSLVHDEQAGGDMDDARFATLRTFPGTELTGFYVHLPRMMASPGSDFMEAQYRRCMDIACTVNRSAMLLYLNSRLEVDRNTGRILERQARAIESVVTQKLRAALVETKDVVDIFVSVDRTNNILSTGELKSTVYIIPYGYPRTISSTLTYFNPALRQALLTP